MFPTLAIEAILERGAPPRDRRHVLGTSRGGREILGYLFGHGPRHVSLIAGCHADEPVGPAMLDRLASHLADLDDDDPLLGRLSFRIVPHANPDGDATNAAWSRTTLPVDGGGNAYDLALYARHAVREPPGDDVEFGFPRGGDDAQARPENRAIAAFLRDGAPYLLHGSFHGMTFAAGPWFLIEASWADDRTLAMRDRLRRRVRELGYGLHDVDRGGEKGFSRIDEGFTTRPDSRAMAAHFEALGDSAMARLFRPSSMEHVRSLGGDPLTLVSEMPLFLLPARHFQGNKSSTVPLRGNLARPPAVMKLRELAGDPPALRREAERLGVRPMPIEDQMRLQLAFLEEALAAALAQQEDEHE